MTVAGKRIGPYCLEGELGRGGTGAVWRARDARSGEVVALKLLLAGRGAGEPVRKRFAREARALGKLKHPNIVSVREVGEEAGVPWLALDLIVGETLQARLAREGPLTLADALSIGAALADALAHCHGLGVLHRDLTPGNVLLRGRVPLLTDFGLTRDIDPSLSQSALTQEGRLMGTPGFWSPEQAAGELARLGPHSDVYGLGATLYATLTGSAPYRGDTLMKLAERMASDPEPPSRLRPGLPRAVDDLLLRCLARRPEDRPSLEEVRRALALGSRGAPRRRLAALALPVGALAVVLALSWLAGSRLSAGGTRTPVDSTSLPADARRREDARDAPRLLQEARAAWHGSDLPQALALSERLIAAEARDQLPEAHLVRAQVLRARKSDTEALEVDAARRARAAASDDGQRALATALEQGVLNDHADAPTFDQAVALRPQDPDAWFWRGCLRFRRGDLRGADEDFTRALELEPGFVLAHVRRGRTRTDLHEHAAAIADHTRVIQLCPRSAEAYNERARARRFAKDPGALEDLERALALDPQLPGAYHQRGLARQMLGDIEGAFQDISRAVELGPGMAGAWDDRGTLRQRRDKSDLDGAIADFTRAVEASPGYAIAYGHRGLARQGKGDTRGAIQDYTRAIELDADLGESWANRAVSRGLLGDKAGAISDAERAASIFPVGSPKAVSAREFLEQLRAEQAR